MAPSPFSPLDEATIDDETEARELEKLLAAADEIENCDPATPTPTLRDDPSFANELDNQSNTPSANIEPSKSLLRNEDLDSSDEEDIQNYLDRKYNEYGRDINQKLKQDANEKKEASVSKYVSKAFSDALKNGTVQNSDPTSRLSQSFTAKPATNPTQKPVLTPLPIREAPSTPHISDPVFHLRIVRPLVSGNVLKERMEGRTPISLNMVERHLETGDLSKDWVIAGVLVNKSPVKKTKKGDAFSIWRLSDLKGEIKMLSLFLFRSAHKDLWKTPEGTVVAVLNPGSFDSRNEKNDVACLTIDTPQKVMILGQSKDLGTCRSKKKNGEPCTAVVNITDCEYCIYHVKQEFNNMSKRSELQSCTAGRGLHELRNKVLGKSEVFYGGQSYTAVPAKKSAKQTAKDQHRLMTLSEYYQSPNAGTNVVARPKPTAAYASPTGPISKIASTVELNMKQRQKDLERLKLLKGDSANTSETESTPTLNSSVSSPAVSDRRGLTFSHTTPSLSRIGLTFDLDPSKKTTPDKAKLKAIAAIKKKPIQKIDPNHVKYRGTVQGKKRAIDLMHEETGETSEAKRRKIEENERKTRIQKIIDATSSHADLVQSRENESRDKYFNKMEKKEALEEKMLSTISVECKAVMCLKCKYTAFSASDRCKEERHPLKVIDAQKRFFECQDCGYRTVTVHKLPKISCKNCSGSRWKRAAMIRERKARQGVDLSIRGDEEKFIGSVAGSSNLNLLVPETD